MAFWSFKQRFLLEGTMPERALLRLKRAKIAVYNVKKPQKNQLLFSVKNKDARKIFAIYPKVCYNINGYSPYKVTALGAEGAGKVVETLKNRVGILLGGLLFCAVCLFADTMVFGVEVVGAKDYRREALIALEQGGIRPFAPYKRGNEDLICSSILSNDGVEFCSIKKTGLWVRVDIRKGNFTKTQPKTGDMTASRTGKILSITALSGTALKAAGDEVREGEPLVGAWFVKPNAAGEEVKQPTEVIARAKIECTYEGDVEAADEECAFAKAYLVLGLSDEDNITQKSVERNGELYRVRIIYTTLQRWNL